MKSRTFAAVVFSCAMTMQLQASPITSNDVQVSLENTVHALSMLRVHAKRCNLDVAETITLSFINAVSATAGIPRASLAALVEARFRVQNDIVGSLPCKTDDFVFWGKAFLHEGKYLNQIIGDDQKQNLDRTAPPSDRAGRLEVLENP
jgi:hypothetical protein